MFIAKFIIIIKKLGLGEISLVRVFHVEFNYVCWHDEYPSLLSFAFAFAFAIAIAFAPSYSEMKYER